MSFTPRPLGAGVMPAPVEVDIEVGRRKYCGVQVIDISGGDEGAVTASRKVIGGDCCELVGFRLRESTGAAAMTFSLHDGSSSAGALIAVGGAAAAGVDDMLFDSCGIIVATGNVFLKVESGSIIGVIYWR